MPRWTMPTVFYIEINIAENHKNRGFGMTNHASLLGADEGIKKWLEVFKKIPSLSSKIR